MNMLTESTHYVQAASCAMLHNLTDPKDEPLCTDLSCTCKLDSAAKHPFVSVAIASLIAYRALSRSSIVYKAVHKCA